ncbi:MAG TPA: lipid A-modifier LpxR family protein, partial [Povalibacter sp.]|nr:lipid A-modifier LpxR family protein [Povalibacter sp.]
MDTRIHKGLVAVLFTALLAVTTVHAESADEHSGLRVQIDNDLFAGGGQHDRDYTGGVAVTISGERARDGLLSLDPVLAFIDRA